MISTVITSLRMHAGIGLLALILLAASVFIVLHGGDRLLRAPSPADLLPADRTIAVATIASSQEWRAVRELLLETLPAGLPDAHSGSTIGVVAVPGGQTAWVMFRPAPAGSAEPYVITASDPSALALINRAPSVMDERWFARLRPSDGVTALVLYPERAGGNDAFLGPLRLSSPFALTVDRETLSLALLHDDAPNGANLPRASSSADPLFSIASGDLASRLTALRRSLPHDHKLRIDALAADTVHSLFGPDAGLADLRPLVDNEAALAIAGMSGSTVRFTLEGKLADSAAADRLAAKLERLYRSAAPAIERERRTFENDLTMDTLRATPAVINEWEESAGGWNARVLTRERGGLPLTLARQGARLLLSNDPDVLAHLRVVAPRMDATVTGMEPAAIASGMLQPSALLQLLNDSFPDAPPAALPLGGLVTDGPLPWTLRSQGDVLTFTLRRLPAE